MNIYYKNNRINSCLIFVILIVIVVSGNSCRKFIEIDSPATSITGENVFTNDETAAAIMTGIYTNISFKSFSGAGGGPTLSFYLGLSADEFVLSNDASGNIDYQQYYSNTLNSQSNPSFWPSLYNTIFITNSVIEGLNNTTSINEKLKTQLQGEAKFVRAFCYFYLVNLYGDVPIATSIDYKLNSVLPRSSRLEVYNRVIEDLKDAQTLLNEFYTESDGITSHSTTDRLRPTKGAATAMLARTYLYMHDYKNAEDQATQIINDLQYDFSGIGLNSVFLTNSREAIWQLQSVQIGWNTKDARLFVLPNTGPNADHPVYLSGKFLNNFEVNDQRKINWIDSVSVDNVTYYYPFKYKNATLDAPITEYEMVLRLGEQYLIRAEARGQQNNINGSQSDINIIRSRAGLPNTSADNKVSLLTVILHERQVELFTEWGHRWLDLNRTNSTDTIMNEITPTKGGIWNSNWSLYPIPLSEIQANPSLANKQNKGYN
ncbi:SusD family protein [Chitinophaga sp. YR573]|uniref:RagB/SusD family nutrient uptake outer membrane protein n=1 Tax=Chitinophaga sp. YR573 TaxID=1881040 RepID=UPI0008B4177D|nr:RagB/SusD family nutrient uptake outer membrane protein [Chitinophaga sp. YR573]SEW37116.1 SusD family protein [Chitinophaga sp. YR573]